MAACPVRKESLRLDLLVLLDQAKRTNERLFTAEILIEGISSGLATAKPVTPRFQTNTRFLMNNAAKADSE